MQSKVYRKKFFFFRFLFSLFTKKKGRSYIRASMRSSSRAATSFTPSKST